MLFLSARKNLVWNDWDPNDTATGIAIFQTLFDRCYTEYGNSYAVDISIFYGPPSLFSLTLHFDRQEPRNTRFFLIHRPVQFADLNTCIFKLSIVGLKIVRAIMFRFQWTEVFREDALVTLDFYLGYFYQDVAWNYKSTNITLKLLKIISIITYEIRRLYFSPFLSLSKNHFLVASDL